MKKLLIKLALRFLRKHSIQNIDIELGSILFFNGRTYELCGFSVTIDHDRGSELKITAKENNIFEKKGTRING